MNRSRRNILIDSFAFVGFVLLTTTGILLHYLLPSGSGHYSTIWGLDRHEWGELHFWISVIFFASLSFHLASHWRWLVSLFSSRHREGSGLRAGLGVVGMAVIIALALSPLLTPVDNKHSSVAVSRAIHDTVITGSMTLADVERATGVPEKYLVEALNLPASTQGDQKLGALKKQYSFEISDVRKLVQGYSDRQ